MDSVFNDIEFLMGNIKQEAPSSNQRAAPIAAEGVQNNDTDQLAMSTYMTDFILDYINRSLKNEDEETEQDNSVTDRENEAEESVEELIERAENMIRENTQHCNHVDISETTINDYIQPFLAEQECYDDNNLINSSGPSTIPAPNRTTVSRVPLLAGNEVSDIISVDTDSDDEVIFVTSHQPTEIPVIDLSDHSSPTDNSIQTTSKRHESRKRTRDSIEIYCDAPAAVPLAKPQEKQYRHSCAICLDDVKSPHSTTCGHIYCGECIKNALKIFKKCPTCNKKLKTSNVHPIYL